LPAVYVPEKGIRELRGLFNSYGLFQKMKVMAKNKVHAMFKQNGYILYRDEVNTGLIKSLNSYELSGEIKMQVELFILEIAHLEKNQAELSTRIYGAGEGYKELIDIITSEPGISVMTALAIISDIGGNVERFPTAKKMASYLASVPSVDSSNEKTRIGHIHKDGRKLSKTRLTQCIMHFRNNSAAIDNFYREKKKGKSAGTVRMAIIRKKLVGIYYMLKRKQYSRNRNEELHRKKMAEYERILKGIREAA
jgi:hypothetical protein